METFIDYCKNYVLENIDEYEGQEVYLCDLGFTLTEYPNCNGLDDEKKVDIYYKNN